MLRKGAFMLALGISAAAVLKELRKQPQERTWHGRVARVVPYDLRPPTLARAADSWWNPNSERVITPQPFGVGWTINFGRVARLAGWA